MSQYNGPADLGASLRVILVRLGTLERTRVTHGNGAPGTGVTEPYVDDTNSKVYFKVNGVWKSVTLA